ncbi:hypothetical protein MOO23_07640 [Rhodococcus opacus]|nr:hypothetical protein [Rhodococcus opacus]UNN04490.1 hypothetical protein MOO23_07640 [Rhodococcus opacus]
MPVADSEDRRDCERIVEEVYRGAELAAHPLLRDDARVVLRAKVDSLDPAVGRVVDQLIKLTVVIDQA